MNIKKVLAAIKKDMLSPEHGTRFIKSGIVLLDKIIPGLPQWTELYGKESSGKSTLALHFAKQATLQDIPVFYVDSEESFDQSRAMEIGVNLDLLILKEPGTIESTFLDIRKFIDVCLANKLQAPLIIWDTITVCPLENETFKVKEQKKKVNDGREVELESSEEFEYEAQNSNSIAERARVIRAQIRKLVVPPTQANFLVINHSITNINPYQEKEITPGGTSLKFQAQLRIQMSSGKVWNSNEGKNIRLNVKKSKFSVPGKRIEIPLNFKNGFMEEFSILFSESLHKKGIISIGRGENTFKIKDESVSAKNYKQILSKDVVESLLNSCED